MFSRAPESRVIISAGLVLLLTALVVVFADAGTSAVQAGVVAAQESPLETPVPVTEIFMPVPASGGRPILGVPTILWEAGLGLVLIGLGLAWRRRR